MFPKEVTVAKLIMPLASAEARGQIAKMLVYFPWKGLNVVRGYVIPSNPNTAAQQSQRTKFTNAVDAFHAAPLTALDLTAWNLFATIFAQIMSGFNTFVKKHVEGAIAGTDWAAISNGVFDTVLATSVDFHCDTSVPASVLTLKYGTSKTFMPNTQASDAAAATQDWTITGLEDGVVYFLQVYTNALGNDAWTGIYRYKHVAP